jgi:cell fate regulator YaaT (PSP1 superfamily)
LRYEYETYEHMQKELPPIGSWVDTPEGRARVVGHEILAAELMIETEDRCRKLVPASQTTPAAAPKSSRRAGAGGGESA